MFKSYLDEAGISAGDPYCVLAGYVGDKLEWDKVDHDWKFVLEAFKVPYFHALEFYGDDPKYANWKQSKRTAFVNALFDCVRDHEVSLLSCAVDVNVFLSLTKDERQWVTGGIHNGVRWKKNGAPNTPYYLPLHGCVIQAASHVPEGEKVWPVMSRHDQYKIKALELYNLMLDSDPALLCRSKMGDEMVFSDPTTCRPLQAADLAAYWSGKAMRFRAKTGTSSLAQFPNRVEIKRVLERMRDWSDLKLFNFGGLMLLLQGCNRYIKSSFPTLDQQLPSVPAQQRLQILSEMRKVNFRKFLDQWQPSVQEDHG